MTKEDLEKLLQADRGKIGEFLAIAESGAVKSGLTDAQKQQQREFVQAQADAYSNAAYRASRSKVNPTTPAYIDAVREMNLVRNNLENLANQQKAISKNQEQFLDDFNEGRISKANYVNGRGLALTDIYGGKGDMRIDEYGNINFKDTDGDYKPYTKLANYAIKSVDTANNILSLFDKVSDAKKPLSKAQMGLFRNNIRGIVSNADFTDVLSLVEDDLLPGFEDIQINPELYNKENAGELKDRVINIVDSAANEINNSKMGGMYNPPPGDPPPQEYVMGSNTGVPLDMRQSYMNQITNLKSGESITIEGISFSDDPRPAKRKGSRGRMTYEFRPDPSGGGYVYGAIDNSTGKLVKSGVISEDQLRLEMLGEGPEDPLQNANVVPPNNPGMLARPTTDAPDEEEITFQTWTPPIKKKNEVEDIIKDVFREGKVSRDQAAKAISNPNWNDFWSERGKGYGINTLEQIRLAANHRGLNLEEYLKKTKRQKRADGNYELIDLDKDKRAKKILRDFNDYLESKGLK